MLHNNSVNLLVYIGYENGSQFIFELELENVNLSCS